MQSFVLPPLGSPLPFPNSSDVAILKYVGSVAGHDGVFCGLELCGSLAARGKNSGSVNGTSYFQVDIPNSGLFVPLRKVVGWLGNSNGNEKFSGIGNGSRNGNGSTSANTNTDFYSYSSSNIISSPTAQKNFVSPSAGSLTSGNDSNNELRRHINVLEKRLVQRENDLRELDVQLDELDATLRTNDARLARKEERFNRYRSEKEDEIKLLVGTIEALEKKVGDAEEIYAAKLKELEQKGTVSGDTDGNSTTVLEEKIMQLEEQLSAQKDMYETFKVSKAKEIDELRKSEMEAFKLSAELERLREESVDILEMEKLKRENEQLLKDMESMKLDMELRDSKIRNLEELLKYSQQDNEALEVRLQNYENGTLTDKQRRNIVLQSATTVTTRSNEDMLDENGGLKVFVPDEKIDPSAGREDFCSFCDREGHSTDDCPYEKDNIEMF